jgi:hypothetical protein
VRGGNYLKDGQKVTAGGGPGRFSIPVLFCPLFPFVPRRRLRARCVRACEGRFGLVSSPPKVQALWCRLGLAGWGPCLKRPPHSLANPFEDTPLAKPSLQNPPSIPSPLPRPAHV